MSDVTTPASKVDGYASAMLDIARAEGDATAVVDEIHAAAMALDGNGALIETLRDRRIPHERKAGIIDDLLGSRVTPVTVAAIDFLVAAGQAGHLGAIAARLAELAAAAEGEVVAEVRTPMDMDADQVSRLERALASATGKRVQVRVVVDPSVIGGAVTKVGDTVLDGSIRGRFTELREQWG